MSTVVKKCICDEMIAKAGFGVRITFLCPKHGGVTYDTRALVNPPIVQIPVTTPDLSQAHGYLLRIHGRQSQFAKAIPVAVVLLS
jgi:hypothetical protein